MKSMIKEQKKKKILSRKRKYEMELRILNWNNIINYIHKRVILRYKVPLSLCDH